MAGSIRLFQFFQKCHRTIGIYPSPPNRKQNFPNLTQAIFLTFSTLLMLMVAGFFVFEAQSMIDYGLAFYAVVSINKCIVVYLIYIWQLQNTSKFIENCERFIEQRGGSMVAYRELIGKIEKFNKFLCFTTNFSLAVFICSALPYSFVSYYIFDMGEESFYLFLPSWLPFNWKTPFGYLVIWLVQYAGCSTCACEIVQFLNLIFASCWLFIFIAQDITQDVTALNIIIAKPTSSDENRVELTKRFCDGVHMHSNAKQCVFEFNQMIRYSLFAFFTWNMLAISSMLVTIQFELWANDGNSFEISLLFFVLSWMIIIIFVLCEPGARVTNQFIVLSEELSWCDWYLLSIEMQRMYMFFLSDTQHPVKIFSYANITCERDTSKKMINTAFSYFMTLRRFRI